MGMNLVGTKEHRITLDESYEIRIGKGFVSIKKDKNRSVRVYPIHKITEVEEGIYFCYQCDNYDVVQAPEIPLYGMVSPRQLVERVSDQFNMKYLKIYKNNFTVVTNWLKGEPSSLLNIKWKPVVRDRVPTDGGVSRKIIVWPESETVELVIYYPEVHNSCPVPY